MLGDGAEGAVERALGGRLVAAGTLALDGGVERSQDAGLVPRRGDRPRRRRVQLDGQLAEPGQLRLGPADQGRGLGRVVQPEPAPGAAGGVAGWQPGEQLGPGLGQEPEPLGRPLQLGQGRPRLVGPVQLGDQLIQSVQPRAVELVARRTGPRRGGDQRMLLGALQPERHRRGAAGQDPAGPPAGPGLLGDLGGADVDLAGVVGRAEEGDGAREAVLGGVEA